jgi:hypothetical protein
MNYRTGKFFSTYGNNFGIRFNEGIILDDNSNQIFDIKNDNKSHLMKFGMDYYINDTLSGYTNKMFFRVTELLILVS